MKALLIPLLLANLTSQAQTTTINVDKVDGPIAARNFYVVGGNPVSIAKYVKVVSGSPYFRDEKLPGSLELYGGSIADSLLIRIDMVDNTVLYSIAGGQEMEATSPVAIIKLKDPATNDIYKFVDYRSIRVTEQKIPEGWYQPMSEGNATIYKKTIKNISEYRPYNSATYEQTIENSAAYYLLVNNTFLQVKKVSELPRALNDQQAAVADFIKKNKLSGKKDEDFITVIAFYNSLTKTEQK